VTEQSIEGDGGDEQARRIASLGLCASCVHRRDVTSGRGSVFVMCALSKTDPQFAKYPRLPVVACPGFRTKD
jgi:hypothetical protein